MKEHEGALNFATEAWTSPNHKAHVAVTVHFENEGVPIAMLLDIELTHSHSGINLAAAFTKILEDFGISDCVRYFEDKRGSLTIHARYSRSPAIMRQTTTR